MPDTAGAGDPAGMARAAKPVIFDASKPHSARIYDYLLGGKDNFAADRETAEAALKSWPAVLNSPNWRSLGFGSSNPAWYWSATGGLTAPGCGRPPPQ